MKKKLIATLVAGAVLSTGLIGLTACGGGLSVPKGGEVANEEAWVKAFTDTVALNNYTLEASSNINFKVNGTVNNGTKDVEVDMTSKATASNLVLYDSENNKAYSEVTTSSDAKGTTNGKEEGSKYSYTSKEYYELSEKQDLITTYWNAEYSKQDIKATQGVSTEEQYWDADETTTFMDNMMSGLNYFLTFYESKDATIRSSIAQLYDKFTYDGGIYTATLYVAADLDVVSTAAKVPCEVKVSIKDGLVTGLSYKADKVEDKLTESGKYDLSYTYNADVVYVVKDAKTTDVSTKVSKDATKAVQEAKDEKEANK